MVPKKSLKEFSKVSIHPKMVENSLLGTLVFIYSFHFLGNQCLSFLEVHILKILKSVMTLAATVARRRYIPGHLVLSTQKITKNVENNHLSSTKKALD
jgi:hypothetical protein